MNSTVAITTCTTYDLDSLYVALSLVCEKANMPNVSGKKVLLKPNILSDAKPEDCITTNPAVIRCMIRLLKNKGALEVFVGDSPGLHSPSFRGENCGIHQVCQQEGAIWVDFSDNPTSKQIVGTKYTLPMANIIDKVDLVFSMCKFKTHQLMYTTGAVKNLFGTIPGLNKGACHAKCPSRESFAKLIVGIHETVKPAFSVMDAIIGMEGAGPANGKPRPIGLLLASDNCFSMDRAEALIMGYNPKLIPIIAEAERKGILPNSCDYPLLKPKDLVIEDFDRIPLRKKNQFFRSLIVPFFTRDMQKRKQLKEPAPNFNHEVCIRCKRCVNICPAKALTFDGKVTIDYTKCIRCYCCHEMCPVNAISIGEQPDSSK